MLGLFTLFFHAPAQAVGCPDEVRENEIPGVPNLAQGHFSGDKDCGPTAAAMILGYWDYHGWTCMIEQGGPFQFEYNDEGEMTGLGGPTKRMARALQDALPYDREDGGTHIDWSWVPFAGDVISAGILEVARERDGGARAWTGDDYNWVEKQDIRVNVTNGHPFWFANLWGEANFYWYDHSSAPDGALKEVGGHAMTGFGYKEVIQADRIDYYLGDFCCDWCNLDEFYVDVRSGWQAGGETRLSYHWAALDDLYMAEIEPWVHEEVLGEQECRDLWDADGDGGISPPIPGPEGEGASSFLPDNLDCDDSLATVYVGAPEICDGIDNDCDGLIDVEDPDFSDSIRTIAPDADGDEQGSSVDGLRVCTFELPDGWVRNLMDCDDTNYFINTNASETCDGIDNNCNGEVDETFPLVADPDEDFDVRYADLDHDAIPDGCDDDVVPVFRSDKGSEVVCHEELGSLVCCFQQGDELVCPDTLLR